MGTPLSHTPSPPRAPKDAKTPPSSLPNAPTLQGGGRAARPTELVLLPGAGLGGRGSSAAGGAAVVIAARRWGGAACLPPVGPRPPPGWRHPLSPPRRRTEKRKEGAHGGGGVRGPPRAVPQCRGSPQFSAYVRGAKGKGARGRWGRPRRKEPGLGEAEQPGLHALVVLWGEGRVLGGAELPPPRRLPSPAGQPWLPRTKLPLPEQGRTC